MNFEESVLFSAVMALLDETQKKERNEILSNNSNVAEDSTFETSYDTLSVLNKMCKIAQELFDKANEASEETQNTPTNEIISGIINGIIFETVESLDQAENKKREVYDFSLKYCSIDTNYPWDIIYMGNGQIAEFLLTIASLGASMIVIASAKANMEDAGIGLIKLMTEFMLYLEDSITKNFGSIVLNKRPPLLVLDKALSAIKKELKSMEDEDPALKTQEEQQKGNESLEKLINNAHSAFEKDDFIFADSLYNKILEIDPNNWEAMIYLAFCSVEIDYLRVGNINKSTTLIAQRIPEAMSLAKKELYSRMDIFNKLENVCSIICLLASDSFVATMNTFKSSLQLKSDVSIKNQEVNSIINMVFTVGDSIEENFGDDYEIVKNLSCACWKIGFTCYENCNMPAPDEMKKYYLKIKKYEPSFECSKPLIGNISENNSGGCYIATAVYGSYDCPQVWTLRRYRDYSLNQSCIGRAFVRFYYATSPTIVKLFKNTKWFNKVFRKLLDKFTKHLILNGYQNTPYEDKSFKDGTDEIKE